MNLHSHRLRSNPLRRRRPLASALALASTAGLFATSTAIAAVTRVVTSCGDSLDLPDCSNGDNMTLRKALFCAQNKDAVDLTQLQCSTITLAEAVVAGTINVTVNGPGKDKLTIDAGGKSRAFIHNGVYSQTLTINKLTIVNGRYDNPYAYSNGGGCIYSSAYLALNSVTVSSCYTSAMYTAATGGAIFANKGAFLTDSAVTFSIAHDFGGHGAVGGGIAAGRMNLTRTTVSYNSASSRGGFAHGGGVGGYSVFADASTISGNSADTAGGGIYVQSLGLRNSTVSGNGTLPDGVIGGIYARVSAEVTNSTIFDNHSGAGIAAGMYIRFAAQGSAFISSTIIAHNKTSGSEFDFGSPAGKSIGGVGGNLIMVTQSGTGVPADTITLDPNLGPLQDNGGPTLTHALLPGSPAIDKGNNPANLASDQRGVPRVENGKADIGAVESDRLFSNGFD